MVVTKPSTRRKTITYHDRVLHTVKDIAAGHSARKPIHLTTIRNAVKKNADATGDTLGKLAVPYIRKATTTLVDEGILEHADKPQCFLYSPHQATKRRRSDHGMTPETPTKRRKSSGGTAKAPALGKQRQSLPAAPAGARKTRLPSIASPPAPARKPRQSAASAPANGRARGRRSQITAPTTAAPPAAGAHDPTASGVDDDENMGDAGATTDEVNNLQGQVEQLTDDLNKKNMEIADLRAAKEKAVNARYTPHSEGNGHDWDDEMHQENFDTVDQQEFEPPVAGPSRVADYPQMPSSSVLGRQGSNLTQISHVPTPAPTEVPSPSSNHALLQSTELLAVRDELTAANAKIARMSRAAALADEQARDESVRLALFSTMEQQRVNSLDTQLTDARALYATELRIAQSDNLMLRGQLKLADTTIRQQKGDLDSYEQLGVKQLAAYETLSVELATARTSIAQQETSLVERQQTIDALTVQSSESAIDLANVRCELFEVQRRASKLQESLDGANTRHANEIRLATENAHSQGDLLRDADNMIDTLKADAARLETELSKKDKEIATLKTDLHSAQSRLGGLDAAVEQKGEEIVSLRASVSAKETALNLAQDELANLRRDHAVLQADLVTANNRIETQVIELKGTIETHDNEIQVLQSQLTESQLRELQLQGELKKVTAKFKDESAALARSRAEVTELQATRTALQNDTVRARHEHEADVAKLEAEKAWVDHELETSTATIAALRNDAAMNQATITELRAALATAEDGRRKDAAQIQSMAKMAELHNGTIRAVERDLKDARAETTTVTTQLDDARREVADLKEQAASANAARETALSKLKDREASHAVLGIEFEKAKRKEEAIRLSVDKLNSDLKQTQSDLTGARQTAAERAAAVETLNLEKDNLEAKIAVLKAELHTRATELKTMDAEMQSAQDALDNANAEISALENQQAELLEEEADLRQLLVESEKKRNELYAIFDMVNQNVVRKKQEDAPFRQRVRTSVGGLAMEPISTED